MSDFSSCTTNSVTSNGSMKATAGISAKGQKLKSKFRRYYVQYGQEIISYVLFLIEGQAGKIKRVETKISQFLRPPCESN